MCNNIKENILSKKENKEAVKDKISDWMESRPILSANIKAKNNRIIEKDSIVYVSGSPLKLHDGTRVHQIKVESMDEQYKIIEIKYSFKKDRKTSTSKIKRYKDDDLLQVEQFLENSQSIIQLINIDLDWK